MTRRAQLVVAAAVVAAIALIPVVAAYLQLGDRADVRAASGYTDPAGNARRVLHRDVHRAAAPVAGNYSWRERGRAVTAVRNALAPRLDALRSARVTEGTASRVAYNETAASRWAGSHCPGGRGRQFGACRANRGFVVQRRAGETTVLAAAFDVTVVTHRGTIHVTYVVEVVG